MEACFGEEKKVEIESRQWEKRVGGGAGGNFVQALFFRGKMRRGEIPPPLQIPNLPPPDAPWIAPGGNIAAFLNNAQRAQHSPRHLCPPRSQLTPQG